MARAGDDGPIVAESQHAVAPFEGAGVGQGGGASGQLAEGGAGGAEGGARCAAGERAVWLELDASSAEAGGGGPLRGGAELGGGAVERALRGGARLLLLLCEGRPAGSGAALGEGARLARAGAQGLSRGGEGPARGRAGAGGERGECVYLRGDFLENFFS